MSSSEARGIVIEWAKIRGSKLKIPPEFIPSGKSLLNIERQDLGLFFEKPEDGEALFAYFHESESESSYSKSSSAYSNFDKQEQLFSSPYKDSTNMVDTFITYAESCVTHYRKNFMIFSAPYICIVQSSGYGKTRLLREVARSVPVMYVCMRPEDATGYPRRSSLACDALFANLNAASEDSYVTELSERLALCVQSALTKLPSPGDKGDTEPFFPSEQLADIVWNFADVKHPSTSSAPETKGQLVILALDEARETLKPAVGELTQFCAIRKALRKFAEANPNQKFLVVFVDTSSRIQNFSPSAKKEQSWRASSVDSEPVALKLYAPFILRNSFDQNFSPLQVQGSLSSLVNCYEYLRAGRPLMSMATTGSMAVGRPSVHVLHRELDLLNLKLHGGQSKRSRQGALSEMLCRLGAFVHPQHPYATEMVADHMATLLETDIERETMLVSYVAEPKLAIAAAKSWQSEALFVEELVPALQYALISGAVDQGARGELVGQIIWQFAFDKCSQQAGLMIGECVDLEQVLMQLLPIDSKIPLSSVIPKHLQGAKVACCQFVNMVGNYSSETHVKAAQRHCGVRVPENQIGIDLVIPVMAKGKTVATVLSQTKNLLAQQGPDAESRSSCLKMLPSTAFSKDSFTKEDLKSMDQSCIRVYMQLGGVTPLAVCQPESGRKALALQIYGIGSRCLSPAVQSCLKELLNGRLTLQNFVRYKHNLRIGSDPFPDSEESILSAWPFICEGPVPVTAKICKLEERYKTNPDQRFLNAELQILCSRRGLPSYGNKSDLKQRLCSIERVE